MAKDGDWHRDLQMLKPWSLIRWDQTGFVPTNWCSWSFVDRNCRWGEADGDLRRFIEAHQNLQWLRTIVSWRSVRRERFASILAIEWLEWTILFGRFRLIWFGKVLWWGSWTFREIGRIFIVQLRLLLLKSFWRPAGGGQKWTSDQWCAA